MLLTKQQLGVHRFCTDDAPQPALGFLHLVPEQRMVEATNGHLLVRVTRTDDVREEDFPSAGVPPSAVPLAALSELLPASVAAEAMKALPKARPHLPILAHAQVLLDGADLLVLTTDLTSPIVRRVSPQDVVFPNIEALVAGFVELKPKAEPVGLNARYLKAISDYALTFDVGRDSPVTVECFGPTDAALFSWSDDAHAVTVWLMPVRL